MEWDISGRMGKDGKARRKMKRVRKEKIQVKKLLNVRVEGREVGK